MKKFPYIIILLLVLCGCVSKSRYETMRRGLDSINERNRNDQPFTVSDVLPFVDFFDSHGEPNDQMLAYYLLGRAYYDNGEAPMALKYYQQAVECADTTSEDCNYAQLNRVYGQMGQVYYQQHLFQPLLQTVFSAIDYAFMAEDTIAAMSYYWQKCSAYEQTGRRENAIAVLDTLAIWYLEHGDIQQSAIAKGRASTILVDMNENEKAREYMSVYEQSSGLFDANGNVMLGREIYYYYKGIMFLNLNMTDSAEFYFRKELSENKDFNNQNSGARGLAELFHKLHQPDSASKYSLYAYVMNDSMYAQMSTEEISRMMSMYDYTRFERIAYDEKEKSSRRAIYIWICIGIIICICLLGILFYNILSHRRQQIESRYLHSLEIIRQARQDIAKLQAAKSDDNSELIAEKEQVIHQQTDLLKSLPTGSLIYKQFSIRGEKPSSEQWDQIKEMVFDLYPQFHDFMDAHTTILNDKEHKTCILIRAGFKPKNISDLLGVGPSYISNIRSEMLKKLFGQDGTPKDFDRRIRQI